jgi:histidinol phosphate phosphatase hisN-like protein
MRDPLGADVANAERWRRGSFTRRALLEALVAGRMAGPASSHDRGNVHWKIGQLVAGNPDLQFGLSGLADHSADAVLSLMAEAAGFDPAPAEHDAPTPIDPERVLDSLERAGDRLAFAAGRGERILLATGHPAGLTPFYQAVGSLLQEHGAALISPADGATWRELGHRREIRYLGAVGVLTDRASTLHTHAPDAMQRMLAKGEGRADLVFADHGFAGAAIEAGIETISIADVNDPAPVVARAQGRTEIVIVMDDNVRPNDYWVCFQVIAGRFP